MQVRFDDLSDHLQRGVKALYVVHGDEPLLALEAGDAIRVAARAAGATEREVFVAEPGFRWDAFISANANRSLFGDRKLVDLRIPSGRPGVEGGKALEGYAADPSPDNVTLVTLPRLDRATQSSAWFEALAGAGVTVAVYPVERDALPAWIATRMKRHQQHASRETLAFLADHCEGNLLAARQEIDKLALLCLPAPSRTMRSSKPSPMSPASTYSSCRSPGSPATRRGCCEFSVSCRPRATRRLPQSGNSSKTCMPSPRSIRWRGKGRRCLPRYATRASGASGKPRWNAR
jgi:DNA polymerase-3 subunit delta